MTLLRGPFLTTISQRPASLRATSHPLPSPRSPPPHTRSFQQTTNMTTEATVRTFFSSPSFAVVGASSNPAKFGYKGLADCLICLPRHLTDIYHSIRLVHRPLPPSNAHQPHHARDIRIRHVPQDGALAIRPPGPQADVRVHHHPSQGDPVRPARSRETRRPRRVDAARQLRRRGACLRPESRGRLQGRRGWRRRAGQRRVVRPRRRGEGAEGCWEAVISGTQSCCLRREALLLGSMKRLTTYEYEGSTDSAYRDVH